MPNYGPFVVEDFVPISSTRILITAGQSYRELNFILETDWDLGNPVEVKRGRYLRLGHVFEGELIYSKGWQGKHQPFQHESGFYYSDDAPTARLYKDGEVLIDHWDGIAEVGNPWIDRDVIYFEARVSHLPAPYGWDIYRADLDGKNIKRLLHGANPCMFEDFLYYGIWNGKSFCITRTHRRDLLPTDPHVPVRWVNPEQVSCPACGSN